MLNIRCKNTANTTSEHGSGKTIRKNAENRNPRKPAGRHQKTRRGRHRKSRERGQRIEDGEGKGRRGGEGQGRTGSRCGRRAAGAGIAIPIGSTAANTLIFGRKPIPIPRKFRIRFRNRSTSVFGRLVVLQQYGRSLAGMVRARAIRRGHRLARQRSGVVIGFMPLPSILWSA